MHAPSDADGPSGAAQRLKERPFAGLRRQNVNDIFSPRARVVGIRQRPRKRCFPRVTDRHWTRDAWIPRRRIACGKRVRKDVIQLHFGGKTGASLAELARKCVDPYRRRQACRQGAISIFDCGSCWLHDSSLGGLLLLITLGSTEQVCAPSKYTTSSIATIAGSRITKVKAFTSAGNHAAVLAAVMTTTMLPTSTTSATIVAFVVVFNGLPPLLPLVDCWLRADDVPNRPFNLDGQ
jgi:hypothetical protein